MASVAAHILPSRFLAWWRCKGLSEWQEVNQCLLGQLIELGQPDRLQILFSNLVKWGGGANEGWDCCYQTALCSLGSCSKNSKTIAEIILHCPLKLTWRHAMQQTQNWEIWSSFIVISFGKSSSCFLDCSPNPNWISTRTRRVFPGWTQQQSKSASDCNLLSQQSSMNFKWARSKPAEVPFIQFS